MAFLPFLALLLLLTWLWRRQVHLRGWDHFPGPSSWSSLPLVGHSYMLARYRGPVEGLAAMRAKYGGVFRFDLGPAPTVIIADHAAASEAYRKEAFSYRPDLPGISTTRGLDPSGQPGGMAFASGRAWTEGKKVFTRALQELGMVKGGAMEGIISQEVDSFCDKLQARVGGDGGSKVEVNELFVRTANAIVWRLGTGRSDISDAEMDAVIKAMLDFHYASNPSSIYYTIVNGSNFLTKAAQLLGFRNIADDAADLMRFLRAEIAKGRPDSDGYVVDRFLAEVGRNEEEGNSDAVFFGHSGKVHVFGNMMDLFIAGTDTISVLMEWSVYYLMCFPEVQEAVAREVREAVGAGRAPDVHDRASTPYAEAALEEVMRFTPETNLTLPHAVSPTAEAAVAAGFRFPAGTRVSLFHTGINFDPENFDRPEEFRPERHLDPETGRFRTSDKVVFFGMGKRRCVGEVLARAESYVFFASLFHRFRFAPPPGFVPFADPERPGLITYPPKFSAIVTARD